MTKVLEQLKELSEAENSSKNNQGQVSGLISRLEDCESTFPVKISDYITELPFQHGFVDEKIEKQEKLKEAVYSKIQEAGGPSLRNSYECKQEGLIDLLDTLATLEYPQLDISFLSMSGAEFNAERGLAYPMFGVFNLSKSDLHIEFYPRKNNNPFRNFEARFTPDMNYQIKKNLIQSFYKGKIEFYKPDSSGFYVEFKEGTSTNRYTLDTHLSTLIPSEVRREIDKSREIFKDEDIYFVAESDWQIHSEPKQDPLIIGEVNDHFYLITNFNMTPAEKFIAENYSARIKIK